MERKELITEWPGSTFQKWSAIYCSKNYWRVSATVGDYDDCMSECALQYMLCRKRYGPYVKNAKHFMRLFQAMVISTFNTYSVDDYFSREALAALPTCEPSSEPDAVLLIKLNEASKEVQQVIRLLLDAPKDLLDSLRDDCRPKQFFNRVITH